VANHPALHKPLPAARKAAEKAAHLAKKKRHADAAAMYRRAVADDPLYFEAWNNLALEQDAAGQRDEAIKTLRYITKGASGYLVACGARSRPPQWK